MSTNCIYTLCDITSTGFHTYRSFFTPVITLFAWKTAPGVRTDFMSFTQCQLLVYCQTKPFSRHKV